MIDSKKGHKLSNLLKAASLSRSTYYFEINKVDIDDKNSDVVQLIKDIFNSHKGRYGVRRITVALKDEKIKINHKKVQRIMKKLELKGITPRVKYHSFKGEVGRIADNIINRNFDATAPNQKWTTDVTQFNCPFGKAYLSPILDMYGTDIVAYDLSRSPNFDQIIRMLKPAFEKFKDLNGLIFHSDQGWQYQNPRYRKMLEEKGIIQSMSRRANCIDNCIMESFFGKLKNEMFYGHENEFQTFEDLKIAIDKYIDYYNKRRIKERTNWMPPVVFRNKFYEAPSQV